MDSLGYINPRVHLQKWIGGFVEMDSCDFSVLRVRRLRIDYLMCEHKIMYVCMYVCMYVWKSIWIYEMFEYGSICGYIYGCSNVHKWTDNCAIPIDKTLQNFC